MWLGMVAGADVGMGVGLGVPQEQRQVHKNKKDLTSFGQVDRLC